MSTPHTELIRAIYNERSSKYDDSFHGLLADEYIRIAQPKEGENVLDLACGTGLVTLPAKEKVGDTGHVVGVDISDGMLDVGRRKAREKGLDVPFIQHDISDLSGLDLLPSGSEGFDLITCAAALVLLPDPAGAVKHWATLLKPGGRLIIDVAAKDANVPTRIFSHIGEQVGCSLQWDQDWVQDESSLEGLLVDAGLQVETVLLTRSFQDREYTVAGAGDAFEKAVTSPMYRNFGDSSVRDKAKGLFVERFVEEAGSSGALIDEAKMYMGVGYRL